MPTQTEPTDRDYALAAWRHEADLCELLLADDDGTTPAPRAFGRHEYLASIRDRLAVARGHIAALEQED